MNDDQFSVFKFLMTRNQEKDTVLAAQAQEILALKQQIATTATESAQKPN